MALALTEEHLQLADAIRRWARRNCPAELVRATADAAGGVNSPTSAGATGPAASAGPAAPAPRAAPAGAADLAASVGGDGVYRESLGPSLARQGAFGLHVPESDGGQGYGLPELTVVIEELGRALVPGGYLPTVLTSAVLVAAGVTGKLVAGLADGSRAGAVALAASMTGSPGADGLLVDGEASPVLGASVADLIILPVCTDSGEVWAAVDADGLEVTALDSLDLTRQVASVRARRLAVPAERLMGGLDRTAVGSIAMILFGAEACGIADWAVRTAAEYAKIRHQFGRPIGQFQAVKHRCAWMLTAAEQAAAAVWDAARMQPGEPADHQREFAAAAVAVVALDAAVSCAHQCIQVLGGIGYTWEHPAHLYYRRALTLRALAGPPAVWLERTAALALSGVHRPVGVVLSKDHMPLRAEVRAELTEIAGVPPDQRKERLAAAGLVAPHLPRPWGRDAGALEQLVIAEELRAARLRPPWLGIGAWVVPALLKYGTPEQQQRFLPPTLRGDIVWCQLFSEPGAGSDLAGLSTRAVQVPGGWRVTGQKIWTSLAQEAAWAICVARTDPAAPRHDGISYLLVDMSAAGIEVRPLRDITGDSLFSQVFLDDVFVPDDCVVGDVNGGWRIARTTLSNERAMLSQSWTFGAGVPELLDVARAVQPAGRVPLGQVGQLVAEGHAIAMLGLRVTLKQLSGTEPGATGSVRKLLAMRHAQRVAEACVAMSGSDGALGAGAGLSAAVGSEGAPNGPHWARQVLMTEALTIGGGTTDIQLNIIAERMLGLPRDSEPPAA
jgi:3-oxochol-4-en-24-oyl-CoA dehydrogenase